MTKSKILDRQYMKGPISTLGLARGPLPRKLNLGVIRSKWESMLEGRHLNFGFS